jgi:hypothetical protein
MLDNSPFVWTPHPTPLNISVCVQQAFVCVFLIKYKTLGAHYYRQIGDHWGGTLEMAFDEKERYPENVLLP